MSVRLNYFTVWRMQTWKGREQSSLLKNVNEQTPKVFMAFAQL